MKQHFTDSQTPIFFFQLQKSISILKETVLLRLSLLLVA